jgi:UDP-3-O-[3-hydroxymyristoyl] glucosamine N-acyltransferase
MEHMPPGESFIDPAARIAANVEIGRFSVVGPNAVIEDGTTIGDHCVVGQPCGRGEPLIIGAGSTIRSHSVLYEGSTIGPGLETGHQVLIRAGCTIGTGARIGTQTALEGDLTIGDYARIQGYSVFGCGTRIGDFVWIFPKCVFTNDPLPPSSVCEPVTIGDGAVICTNTIVMPGCDIGFGAFVASGAKPKGHIPPAAVVLVDGRIGGPVTHLIHLESGTAHPWMSHFADVFPAEAQTRIAGLHFRVMAAARELRPARPRRAAA